MQHGNSGLAAANHKRPITVELNEEAERCLCLARQILVDVRLLTAEVHGDDPDAVDQQPENPTPAAPFAAATYKITDASDRIRQASEELHRMHAALFGGAAMVMGDAVRSGPPVPSGLHSHKPVG